MYAFGADVPDIFSKGTVGISTVPDARNPSGMQKFRQGKEPSSGLRGLFH